MPKSNNLRGSGWHDPPPSTVPLDYVLLTAPPPTRTYKPRRALRRALIAGSVGIAATALIALLPVAVAAMIVLFGLWALCCLAAAGCHGDIDHDA